MNAKDAKVICDVLRAVDNMEEGIVPLEDAHDAWVAAGKPIPEVTNLADEIISEILKELCDWDGTLVCRSIVKKIARKHGVEVE